MTHRITIIVPGGPSRFLGDQVKFIGEQIAQGYTSGHVTPNHHWEMDEEPE